MLPRLPRTRGRDELLVAERELRRRTEEVAALRRRLPLGSVVPLDYAFVEADARGWDYGTLAAPPGGRVLVVGNLPYSVGKPILMALAAARTAIDTMALMLQREVAERVAAAPGSRVYGSLSVLTQLYCRVDLALRVPPGAFRPPPKVESAVIRLAVLPAYGRVSRRNSPFAERREDVWRVVTKGDGPQRVQFPPGQLGRSSR